MADFKPRGRRPRRDSGEGSGRRDFRDRPRRRDSGRRDSREVSMHEAICDECGKTCEVPFKPTASKPVYCDDCFKKENPKKGYDVSKELEQINKKLDKILEAVS